MRVALTPRISNTPIKFSSSKKEETNNAEYKNPINSKLEYLSAIVATISAGFVFSLRVLFELFGDFNMDINLDKLEKKPGKNFLNKIFPPNMNPLAKALIGLAGIIGILSTAYCIVKLPKNLYNTKVETFKKKQEMDVYVRANSTEKKLTEKVDKEAQTTGTQEKQDLATEYLKLKSAKNNVPYFIDSKTLNQIKKMQSK